MQTCEYARKSSIFQDNQLIYTDIPLHDGEKNIKIYCLICFFTLAIVAGLRNENLGLTDTVYVYKKTFYRIMDNDFAYMLTLKDYGFQILTFIFTRICGDNFKLYCLLFTMPYIGAISFMIYRYSSNKCLSFIVFMCLHYYEISFTLMRQICGMAILCLALHLFLEKRYKGYTFCVLLASLFHPICILFITIFVVKFFKFKKWMFVPLLVILFFVLFRPRWILNFVYTYLVSAERFTRYARIDSSKNLMLFIINLTLWSAELLALKKIRYDEKKMMLFMSVTICLIISPLTVALGEMSRIAYLFGMAHVILLPDYLYAFKKGINRKIARVGTGMVLIIYFLFFLGPQVNIIPYYM